ncbi:MAG TPA: FGGY family carbohydrate kinase [Terriglobia bacterium]|nr:FGGY family carbohydrate kinase [Terriglobia bacterium]
MNVLCFDVSSGGISAAIMNSALAATRFVEVAWRLETDERGAATLSVAAVLQHFKSVIAHLQLAPNDNIDALVIDTFLHNCVLLDASDQPLTPVFTWLDHRGRDGVEKIRTRFGDRFHQRTGCRFHPMFPVFKLASMHLSGSPEISAAGRVVSIKAILIHELTGVWIEDHGIAASSGLFDVQEGNWDAELLELCGLNTGLLPPVASRNKRIGRITSGASARFGLPENIEVVNGTGDGFAANVGSACEGPEKIAVTLGTSAVVRQTVTKPVLVEKAGTFCYMANENVFLLGCAGSNGGNVLDWGRAILGSQTDPAASVDPPLFMPLLHGERSPEWDPTLTGSWHGLTAAHSAADLSRSILEGVIFNLAYFVEIVQTTSSIDAASLVVSGNAFLQPMAAPILAAVVRRPVWVPDKPGLMSLRGVAICAFRALGESVPKLSLQQVAPFQDAKILFRYAEYRRIRGNLARA